MIKSSHLLANIGRYTCNDLGQEYGTREEVFARLQKRSLKARKSFIVVILGLDHTGQITTEKWQYLAIPGKQSLLAN